MANNILSPPPTCATLTPSPLVALVVAMHQGRTPFATRLARHRMCQTGPWLTLLPCYLATLLVPSDNRTFLPSCTLCRSAIGCA